MASPNDVYYSSNGDFEEEHQFDSLLGSTRQRRIGGITPYRDDPVRENHTCIHIHVHGGARVATVLLSTLSLLTYYSQSFFLSI
jgi:hypothetical protein